MTNQLFIEKAAAENTDSDSYYTFFKDSIGEGPGTYFTGIGEVYRSTPHYQRGYGLLGFPSNSTLPRGRGLGSIFASLWKIAAPMIKTGAKKLGSAALDVATNVAADALQGKDIRESAKEHLSTSGTQLLKTLNPNLGATAGSNKDAESSLSAPSSSPASALAAPPPPVKTVFRKIPRKRQPAVATKRSKFTSKQAKYSVLKYM